MKPLINFRKFLSPALHNHMHSVTRVCTVTSSPKYGRMERLRAACVLCKSRGKYSFKPPTCIWIATACHIRGLRPPPIVMIAEDELSGLDMQWKYCAQCVQYKCRGSQLGVSAIIVINFFIHAVPLARWSIGVRHNYCLFAFRLT